MSSTEKDKVLVIKPPSKKTNKIKSVISEIAAAGAAQPPPQSQPIILNRNSRIDSRFPTYRQVPPPPPQVKQTIKGVDSQAKAFESFKQLLEVIVTSYDDDPENFLDGELFFDAYKLISKKSIFTDEEIQAKWDDMTEDTKLQEYLRATVLISRNFKSSEFAYKDLSYAITSFIDQKLSRLSFESIIEFCKKAKVNIANYLSVYENVVENISRDQIFTIDAGKTDSSPENKLVHRIIGRVKIALEITEMKEDDLTLSAFEKFVEVSNSRGATDLNLITMEWEERLDLIKKVRYMLVELVNNPTEYLQEYIEDEVQKFFNDLLKSSDIILETFWNIFTTNPGISYKNILNKIRKQVLKGQTEKDKIVQRLDIDTNIQREEDALLEELTKNKFLNLMIQYSKKNSTVKEFEVDRNLSVIDNFNRLVISQMKMDENKLKQLLLKVNDSQRVYKKLRNYNRIHNIDIVELAKFVKQNSGKPIDIEKLKQRLEETKLSQIEEEKAENEENNEEEVMETPRQRFIRIRENSTGLIYAEMPIQEIITYEIAFIKQLPVSAVRQAISEDPSEENNEIKILYTEIEDAIYLNSRDKDRLTVYRRIYRKTLESVFISIAIIDKLEKNQVITTKEKEHQFTIPELLDRYERFAVVRFSNQIEYTYYEYAIFNCLRALHVSISDPSEIEEQSIGIKFESILEKDRNLNKTFKLLRIDTTLPLSVVDFGYLLIKKLNRLKSRTKLSKEAINTYNKYLRDLEGELAPSSSYAFIFILDMFNNSEVVRNLTTISASSAAESIDLDELSEAELRKKRHELVRNMVQEQGIGIGTISTEVITGPRETQELDVDTEIEMKQKEYNKIKGNTKTLLLPQKVVKSLSTKDLIKAIAELSKKPEYLFNGIHRDQLTDLFNYYSESKPIPTDILIRYIKRDRMINYIFLNTTESKVDLQAKSDEELVRLFKSTEYSTNFYTLRKLSLQHKRRVGEIEIEINRDIGDIYIYNDQTNIFHTVIDREVENRAYKPNVYFYTLLLVSKIKFQSGVLVLDYSDQYSKSAFKYNFMIYRKHLGSLESLNENDSETISEIITNILFSEEKKISKISSTIVDDALKKKLIEYIRFMFSVYTGNNNYNTEWATQVLDQLLIMQTINRCKQVVDKVTDITTWLLLEFNDYFRNYLKTTTITPESLVGQTPNGRFDYKGLIESLPLDQRQEALLAIQSKFETKKEHEMDHVLLYLYNSKYWKTIFEPRNAPVIDIQPILVEREVKKDTPESISLWNTVLSSFYTLSENFTIPVIPFNRRLEISEVNRMLLESVEKERKEKEKEKEKEEDKEIDLGGEESEKEKEKESNNEIDLGGGEESESEKEKESGDNEIQIEEDEEEEEIEQKDKDSSSSSSSSVEKIIPESNSESKEKESNNEIEIEDEDEIVLSFGDKKKVEVMTATTSSISSKEESSKKRKNTENCNHCKSVITTDNNVIRSMNLDEKGKPIGLIFCRCDCLEKFNFGEKSE